MALAGAVAVLPASAGAATIGTQGWGMSGTLSTNHVNRFNRDGVPSTCPNPITKVPTQTTGPESLAYRSRVWRSNIGEAACVTASITTSCSGGDAIMSETYSPAYDPAAITTNWIGDLGDHPPDQTAYSFTVPGGAQFETVVDEIAMTANCGGVDVTWTSDRPWANLPPIIRGVAAVGREIRTNQDVWQGDPAVAEQWLRCDAAGSGCAAIPGATDPAYVPTDADIGHALALRESATENGLTSTSVSRATQPAIIPAIVRDDSLAAGDASMMGKPNPTNTPSTCDAPKTVPNSTGFTDLHLYDAIPVTSLINEPLCVSVQHGLDCALSLLTVYIPAFVPADIRQNYVADDGLSTALSYTLPAGATSVAVHSDWAGINACSQYTIVVGSTAPFATASPALGGQAAEGSPQTTTNGEWGGSPSFQQSWLRCDADGNACEAIAGAGGASYTPTAADVGHRLRSRIAATQVNTSSADSAPSAVIGPDVTPPHGTLALVRTNLKKVLKSGFIPVTATCDENCAVKVSAVVSKKAAKRLGKKRRIAGGKGSARPGTRSKLRVKLTRRARRALRTKRLVRFQLVATFTDTRGNAAGVRKKAALRRKR
jgi:hypothetical protein